MLDIIEAGIKNPVYSTCAFAELLRQVYESDHLILEVVDDFSSLYKGSIYKNFKYYNDNDLFGDIPPYHIAHMRYFVNLDGHKLKRGLKVVASSIGNLYKHHFDIKKIMLPVCIIEIIQNMSIEFQISPTKSFWKQWGTTFSLAIGRQTTTCENTHFTCSLFVKEIGWISFEPLKSVTIIDNWINGWKQNVEVLAYNQRRT